MSDIERLPPHSIEAEEAVLGSLLIDPDAIFEVAGFLKPEAFYRVHNRWIYDAIVSLNERHEAIDFITLTEELRRREHHIGPRPRRRCRRAGCPGKAVSRWR